MHGSSRRPAPRPAPGSGRGATALAADSERLARLIEPVVTAMGMDLEGVRLTSAGRRRLLRVTVDADGGVSLDDIAEISRELSARLDGAVAMGEAPYTLEVSSPGTDRPLTEPRHWRRAVGRLVTAPLAGPGSGTTRSAGAAAAIEGRVVSADDHQVRIEVAGAITEFGYAEVGPGRIQVEFTRLAARGEDEDAGEEEPDGH
jgi:ribosome maturation factor RimP